MNDLAAGTPAGLPLPVALDRLNSPQLLHVKAEVVTWEGRRSLRVTDITSPELQVTNRLVVLPDTELADGVIELEVAGEVAEGAQGPARGFVGVAFRVQPDGEKFECLYLRPTNGRADDQVRRNHSVQYSAEPDFPWHKLREEFPEKYESYVDLVPGVWTKVRIEVSGTTARLFVHGVAQPTLIVDDLKLGESRGAVALWIGPGTVAHFDGLQLTRAK